MRKAWITSLMGSIALGLVGSVASAQDTDGINHISAIEVAETADQTVIEIVGDENPTYSVYRLRNPLRLFVDVSNSALSDDLSRVEVDNGVINNVMTVEYEDALTQVTRVVIGFDQDALYDVEQIGDRLVVSVDGSDRNLFVADGPSSDAELEELRAELAAAQSRMSALEQAAEGATDVEVQALQAQLERERAEVERLLAVQAEVARLEGANAQAQTQVLELTQQRQDVLSQLDSVVAERERLEAELIALRAAGEDDSSAQIAELTARHNEAQTQIAQLQQANEASNVELVQLSQVNDETLARLAELESAQGAAEAEIARLTAERDALATERSSALGEVDALVARISELEAERSGALAEIEQTRHTIAEARGELERRDAEVDALNARSVELEDAIAAERERGGASLQALVAERDAHVADLERRQAELESLLETQASRELELQAQVEQAQRMADETRSLRAEREALDARQAELDDALAAVADEQQAAFAQQEALATREAELASREDDLRTREAELTEMASDLEALRAQWSETAPAVSGTPEIVDVRFDHANGVDRVVIEVPAGTTFSSLPWQDGRSGLLFDSATLPDHLRRTLDTTAFAGPLNYISSFTDDAGQVRVVAELNGEFAEVIRQESQQLIWEFTPVEDEVHAAGTLPNAGPPTQSPVVSSYTSQAENYDVSALPDSPENLYTQRPRMNRSRITLDVRDAPIQEILRLFGDEGNLNIVASDSVSGSVTMRLRSVPLDDALMAILRSQGFGWEQTGNILRVAPMEELTAEYDEYLERLAASYDLAPLQVRLIPVNYAEAGDLQALVAGLLSSRGSAAVDERNNMLIVTDVAGNLDAAEALVAELDNQTPQILIEARIVETNDQFTRQLGIQWGGDFVADQSLGNATGLLFPSTIGIAGGAADQQTPTAGGSATPNYAVNLPAPAGTGEGGAIGFTFGSLGGALNLNVRLSAAESMGSAKIVSAPRIMTLDNESASISSGVSIPISVVSAQGVQTVFIDATLDLTVTPRVTPDGNVYLEVDISKNEPDFQNTGAQGDPSIVSRQASTQLLVRDGDTTVIGGIFQHNSGSNLTAVPFFGHLPVIGPLFRTQRHTDTRNELLVFITPRIVNRDLSIDSVGNGADIIPPQEEE